MRMRIVLSCLFALFLAACALDGIGTSPSGPGDFNLPDELIVTGSTATDAGVDAE